MQQRNSWIPRDSSALDATPTITLPSTSTSVGLLAFGDPFSLVYFTFTAKSRADSPCPRLLNCSNACDGAPTYCRRKLTNPHTTCGTLCCCQHLPSQCKWFTSRKPVHGQTDDTLIVLRPGQHTTEVNIPLRQALPCRRAKPWREHHIPHTCKVLNQHTRIAHVRST